MFQTGQWQGGEYYGIGPSRLAGARAPVVPKAGLEAVSDRGDAAMLAVDIVLTGLIIGGMYALTALGLTLQYGVARIMNLSYGEFVVARGAQHLLALHRCKR